MSLIIALPRERRFGERRVALDPSRVERLQQSGLQVRIETECGHAASFHDESYQDVTVMSSFAEVVREADIVVKVVCPTLEEIALLRPHSILLCIVSAFQHLEEVEAMRERQITVLGMDHLPRTTRAQPMDALSSQATVAGYKAALLAAELSPRLFPMLTTAAGTIRPSRVLVVGAGVAGLQAIATSRRLGAQVEAYDIRKAAKEQIESLGARMIDTGVEVEGAGGVARALRKDEKQLQHDVLAEHLSRAHVVICAAALPGRRAPRIITEDMVDGMLPESVIVDMAASTGGNCELTRIGEHYYHNDTLIVGPLNLPSHGAVHASEMYARNVHNMLGLIIVNNEIVLNAEDEIIARCVLLHAGRINHPNIAGLLETEAVPFGRPPPVTIELPDQNSGWLREEADSRDEKDMTVSDSSGELRGGSIDVDAELGDKATTAHTAARAPEHSRGPAEPGEQRSSIKNRGEGRDATNPEFAAGQGHEPELFEPSESENENDVDEQDLRDLAALEGVDAEEIITSHAAGEATVCAEDPELLRDELILIDGVGPALQERLYSFGYRRWQDLARLDDKGIEKLTVQLELDNEVREQDWRGQAQRLMEEQA